MAAATQPLPSATECPFEMEMFIAAIQVEPAVWNYTSESYKNRMEKTKAWDKICMSLYPNFTEMADKEKTDVVSLLQRKWKSLRDSYNRELNKLKKVKSADDAFSKRKYIYFDQLSFLQPLAEQRISLCQQEEKEITIKEEIVDSISDHVEQEIVEEMIMVPQQNHKKPKINPVAIEAVVSPTESPRTRGKTRKKQRYKHRDEDILFCLSLVNDLKRIPEVMRTDAKCDILQVLKRYKMAVYPGGGGILQYQHPPGPQPPAYTDTGLLRLAQVEMGPASKKPRKSHQRYSTSSSSSSSQDTDPLY